MNKNNENYKQSKDNKEKNKLKKQIKKKRKWDTYENYTLSAFWHPLNLIFLGIGVITLFILRRYMHLALPILILLEVLYLMVIPKSQVFKRYHFYRKTLRFKNPEKVLDMKIFRELDDISQGKFIELLKIRSTIEKNVSDFKASNPGSFQLINESMEKLNQLMNNFLYFSKIKYQLYNTMNVKEKKDIEKELSYIKEKIQMLNNIKNNNTNEHINNNDSISKGLSEVLDDENQYYKINIKRISILEERLKKFNKASRLVEIINVQLKAIEDLMKLIRDQSIIIREPKEMAKQLDDLLHDMKIIDEIESEITDMPI